MTKKLWGGRFKKVTDPDFERFSASFRWDKRLLPYELRIDAVHVNALKDCGVLNGAEAKKLKGAIDSLRKKIEKGTIHLNERSEDIHSAVQEKLEELTGPLAHKLHTARSRNDLVSQSSRLYCKEHAQTIISLIDELQREIIKKAEAHQSWWLPGMTHLQNAQVLSLAHILLAYVEMLERSKRRFGFAVDLADVCVLGSGALGGSAYPLDQKMMARELGLSRVTDNSYDVSGDRDFLLHLLSTIAFLSVHLSRISEDLMIAQTKGFAIVDIDEAFCTGSSMMPQKKNADFVELTRGASGVFISNLTGFLVTLKGLPTSYNRDLQWDKSYIFDSVETCEMILEIYTKLFRTIRWDQNRIAELLKDESLYATDLADYLVLKGTSFKIAHEQVGKIVSFAEERRVPISKIGLDILKRFAPRAEGDVYGIFSPEHSVRMKKTKGSTHPAEVAVQIQRWKRELKAK